MSLMRTEYRVECLRQGEVRAAYGSYDSLEYAEKQKESATKEREKNGPGGRWWLDTYRIVERDVTEWTPVPTHTPDWPDSDPYGQLND